ncbi:hypothetical protein O6R08_03870 [Cutibacterium equinum]|uniref:Uncharacterized protein n=1 Tax=Cutibacterium equinum TaxID=3016342 RepID=A0ABY7R013_9ACTN|nr:hypothetical protein [Cutibacterium equinum]WCC80635.1 hypothetical protein O6R08_03870 [Cutibacterium equinum]
MVAATSVPAFAASPDYSADIEELFNRHTADLKKNNPDAEKVALEFSWHISDQPNGEAGAGALKMTNASNENFRWGDMDVHPTKLGLAYEFAVLNVDTSPVVNETLAGNVHIDGAPIVTPWSLKAGNKQVAQPGDAASVNKNNGPSNHRYGWTDSSYVRAYKRDTLELIDPKNARIDFDLPGVPSEWTTEDGRNVYGALMAFSKKNNEVPLGDRNLKTGKPGASDLGGNGVMRLNAYTLKAPEAARDRASTKSGPVFIAMGIRPIGFAAPTWEDVVTMAKTKHPEFTNAQIESSYRDAYTERTKKWFEPDENGEAETMLGMKFYYLGWGKDYNYGTKPRLSHGEWFWSHEAGNFRSVGAHGGREGNQGGLDGEWANSTEFFNRSLPDVIQEIETRDGVY